MASCLISSDHLNTLPTFFSVRSRANCSSKVLLSLCDDVDNSARKIFSSLFGMLFFYHKVSFGSIGMVSISSTTFLQTVPEFSKVITRASTSGIICIPNMFNIGYFRFQFPNQWLYMSMASGSLCVVPSEEVIAPSPQMMHHIGALLSVH